MTDTNHPIYDYCVCGHARYEHIKYKLKCDSSLEGTLCACEKFKQRDLSVSCIKDDKHVAFKMAGFSEEKIGHAILKLMDEGWKIVRVQRYEDV